MDIRHKLIKLNSNH